MIKRLNVSILYCKKCDSVIWSQHVHDFVSCKCGAICIDGGGEYTRCSGDITNIESYNIVIPQNRNINTHKQYIKYVDARIDVWKKTDFIKLKHSEKSNGYAKIKEVIEWVKKKIFKLYHI